MLVLMLVLIAEREKHRKRKINSAGFRKRLETPIESGSGEPSYVNAGI